jgi:acyl-CoA thioester hydrolase
LFVGEIGNSSFMAHYEIRDDEYLYASGYSKIVWVDYQKEKSVPLPNALKEKLI